MKAAKKDSADYKEIIYSDIQGIQYFYSGYMRYNVILPIKESKKYYLTLSIYGDKDNEQSARKAINSEEVQDILNHINQKVTNVSFATWFKPLKLLFINDEEVIIKNPGKVVVDQLNNYYKDIIDETLLEVSGKSLTISFKDSLFWEYFVNNRELISHMNIRKAILSITGQAINTLKQGLTDGKKYANGLRHFITHWKNS